MKSMSYCFILLSITLPALADTQDLTQNPSTTQVKNSRDVDSKQLPPTIEPYTIPTFIGEAVDWRKTKPAINPQKKINGDAIFQIINRCYPLKSGFSLEVNLRGGVNYKPAPSSGSTTVQTYDSQSYYAGIVANMPLYSDIEIDKGLINQKNGLSCDTLQALGISGVQTKYRFQNW